MLMKARRQQKRKPSSAPPANPQPSVTTPKRMTTRRGITPPTQPKRPRTMALTLTTDDIPGIAQAVVNALPTISSQPPDQGQTPTGRSSRREDSASSTSTLYSEDSGTHDFWYIALFDICRINVLFTNVGS